MIQHECFVISKHHMKLMIEAFQGLGIIYLAVNTYGMLFSVNFKSIQNGKQNLKI